MAKETFKAARMRLLTELSQRGWTVNKLLKVPTAIDTQLGPDLGFDGFKVKLYFHPQSVYLHKYSMHLDDIRGMTIEAFIAAVCYWTAIQANRPAIYG